MAGTGQCLAHHYFYMLGMADYSIPPTRIADPATHQRRGADPDCGDDSRLTSTAHPADSGRLAVRIRFWRTAGDLLARKLIESGRSLLHGYGATGFFLLAIALCFLLVPLALGLQRHEWRALMIAVTRTSRGIASLFRTIGRRGVAHATPDIAGYAPEEPARHGYAGHFTRLCLIIGPHAEHRVTSRRWMAPPARCPT